MTKKRSQNPPLGPHEYPVDMSLENVKTIRRVKPFTMTTAERLNGLCDAVKYITTAGIKGDVVECGACKGGSMMTVAVTLHHWGEHTSKLHLFDTYAGMSEPPEKDVSFPLRWPIKQRAFRLITSLGPQLETSVYTIKFKRRLAV